MHFLNINFQKCSKNGALRTICLRHVLRASSRHNACTFSRPQLPKVVWDPQFFYTFDIFWLPNVLGQSADFLRGVAFWSIRSSGLLRWFCMTGAALRMTWHHFFVAGAILCKDTWTGTTTNYTTPHHTTFSSCGRGDHCIHSKKHNSDHLLVHQWIRSAIHASQTIHLSYSCLCWNFRHRLVRYYWYKSIDFHSVMHTV